MIILGTNSIKAAGGFNVANSARFGNVDGVSSANDTLIRTPGSASNRKTFTISFWMKRSELQTGDTLQQVIGQQASGYFRLTLGSNEQGDILRFYGGDGFEFRSKIFVRDTSAWYHIVLAMDTTQGTASNRAKLYVNGVQQTEFYTANYPNQNTDQAWNVAAETRIGSGDNGGGGFSGYLCEVVNIDGAALAPTSFGEFDDSGIWKPINVSGLTFGTNGFYLDFEDSGDLGDDESGNGNDFAETGLDATHQSTDTCTNNSATIGTLFMGLNTPTFSEGNLQSYSSAAGLAVIPSSIGLASGKWYAELKYAATSSNDNTGIGINMDPASSNQQNTEQGGYTFGYAASTGGYTPYQANQSGSGPTYTVGDIMGIYMDLDNMKLYFSKNGTLNSSTGLTINVSNTGFYYFCVQDYTSTSNFWTWQWNFGAGCPFAISSGNTDANGYGNFEYSPTITGDGASKDFFACNTKNLAEYG